MLVNPDEKFMKAAIKEAKKAAAKGDVPIGCVLVRDGKIAARGYNRRNYNRNTLDHAELIAIDKACSKRDDWRLEEYTMYITLEPCPMCAGAIVQARIPKVVIGAMNPKAGSCGSVIDLLHVDKFNHQVETVTGVLGEECAALLTDFFKELRKENKETDEDNRLPKNDTA